MSNQCATTCRLRWTAARDFNHNVSNHKLFVGEILREDIANGHFSFVPNANIGDISAANTVYFFRVITCQRVFAPIATDGCYYDLAKRALSPIVGDVTTKWFEIYEPRLKNCLRNLF